MDDVIDQFENSTFLHPCSIHQHDFSTGMTKNLGIPIGITAKEYAMNHLCLLNMSAIKKKNCLRFGTSLAIIGGLGLTRAKVEITNAFGDLVMKGVNVGKSAAGLHDKVADSMLLRTMMLLNNEGLHFDEQRKEFYSRGYCAPKFICPLSIPELAVVEIPRCGSTVLKKWIMKNEFLHFQQSERASSDEPASEPNDLIWRGHYPYTKMPCCKYATGRMLVVSVRNPFDRALSLFRNFFLNNSHISNLEDPGSFLSLDNNFSDVLTVLDHSGNDEGVFNMNNLDHYIRVSSTYTDLTSEAHHKSQMVYLLNTFVERNTPVLPSEVLPRSVTALRAWLQEVYIVHTENLHQEMVELMQLVPTSRSPSFGLSMDMMNYSYSFLYHPLKKRRIQTLSGKQAPTWQRSKRTKLQKRKTTLLKINK